VPLAVWFDSCVARAFTSWKNKSSLEVLPNEECQSSPTDCMDEREDACGSPAGVSVGIQDSSALLLFLCPDGASGSRRPHSLKGLDVFVLANIITRIVEGLPSNDKFVNQVLRLGWFPEIWVASIEFIRPDKIGFHRGIEPDFLDHVGLESSKPGFKVPTREAAKLEWLEGSFIPDHGSIPAPRAGIP
jgi:hypothetical protein